MIFLLHPSCPLASSSWQGFLSIYPFSFSAVPVNSQSLRCVRLKQNKRLPKHKKSQKVCRLKRQEIWRSLFGPLRTSLEIRSPFIWMITAEPISPLRSGAEIPSLIYVTDRKSTRLNSSHVAISYAVFCWKKKKLAYFGYVVRT